MPYNLNSLTDLIKAVILLIIRLCCYCKDENDVLPTFLYLYQFPKVIVRNYHKLGDLKNNNSSIFFPLLVLESRKPKSRCQLGHVPSVVFIISINFF